MRASTIVMIGFAVVFGLIAVFIAQVWLNNQANVRAKNLDANNKPQIAAQTVVVAKQPLRFGTELNASMLQEVPWPSNALPSGAFAKIQDIVSEWPPRRSGRDRSERAGARAQDHRRRSARDAVGAGQTEA